MAEERKTHFDTTAVHAGLEESQPYGATVAPIVQSSSFAYKSAKELEDVFAGRSLGYIYSRINNPTVACLEKKLTALENGIGAVACASGMAAITVAVASIAAHGDEIIAGNSLFGGTYSLFAHTLARFDIRAKFVESSDTGSYLHAISERTKLIFVESVGNPKLDIPDIKAISTIAHQAGIPLIVDNTVTTPYLFQPREWGADIVIHSSTKYLNGHGNSVGGVIVDMGTFGWNGEKYRDFRPYLERFGDMAYLSKIRKEVHRDFGPCLSPLNAFLTVTGIETLGLRMQRHCDNALALAVFLKGQKKIQWINYPGFPEHPRFSLAARQFHNKFGALVTFGMGSKEKAFAVIDSLRLSKNLANLGDARTLVIHPASTICADFSEDKKREMGVTEDMVRVSAGIEDSRDIIDDFREALEKV